VHFDVFFIFNRTQSGKKMMA